MAQYLIRRLLIGFLTLLMITMVVYGLIRAMPGDPTTVDMAEGNPNKVIKDADKERLKQIYGLDKPVYQAYGLWLSNLVRLDLGTSFKEKGRTVVEVIGDKVGPTLLLSGVSLLLAYVISIPLGLWTTVRHGQPMERVTMLLLFMLYSIPSFVTALLLLIAFHVSLGGSRFQLPLGGMHGAQEPTSFFGSVWDLLQHMILPVICATYGSVAYFTRFVKSNTLEVIRQDYIRTARAKGVGPVRIVMHHAFRNTLIPLVTMLGLTLPGVLSGLVILENIFNWPGMGRLFLESITTRDYPVIMGLTLMFSVLTLMGQLLADILYALVDPRVSYK